MSTPMSVEVDASIPLAGGNVQQLILDQLSTLRSEQRGGFDSIRSEFNLRLDRLVTNEAFSAEQKRVDERNAALGREVADERAAREKACAATEARLDKMTANFRWLIGMLISLGVPAAVFMGNLVLNQGG